MKKMTSWGQIINAPHDLKIPKDTDSIADMVTNLKEPLCIYGKGKSYGDVALNPNGILFLTDHLDNFLYFDTQNGIIRCESGVLLRDIQQVAIKYGWLLAVTPGTQLISVGGAIANDVHGKNHHVHGTFGHHLLSLDLLRTDGERIKCSPNDRSDWFKATVGGLGLTGIIIEAEIQLLKVPGPYLDTETLPYSNLPEFFKLSNDSESEWEQTVSWIDCATGGNSNRGIFMRANPSMAVYRQIQDSTAKTIPFTSPVSLINKISLRPFNFAYYHLQKMKAGKKKVHYEPFSYPLDNLHEWNRIYGPKGFYQYQSVIPTKDGEAATKEMLHIIKRSGNGSFLAVLKVFGDIPSAGMMSFPKQGVTLALDFPNKGTESEKLFRQLDSIVAETNGRIYCAKDARMPKELFESGYPELDNFLKFRDKGISSALSRRLLGE